MVQQHKDQIISAALIIGNLIDEDLICDNPRRKFSSEEFAALYGCWTLLKNIIF